MTLLPGKLRLPVEPEPAPVIDPAPQTIETPKPRLKLVPRDILVNHVPGGLDKSTWKSFATGKIRAVRRLDLHGLTATRAHNAVTHFLERAYADEVRCVEIITGKGEVIARELPHWLNHPQLRGHILAVAHPHAANTGSVRVLLRRVRP
ncbi:MAG: Smr/MutS family protein [Acidocella sp.]|nr:Smr/MutS family protein [Acidocella sp.]